MFACQERAAVLPRIPLGVPATRSAGSGVVNALGTDQALLVIVLVMPAMILRPGNALFNNPPLGVQVVGLLPDGRAAGACGSGLQCVACESGADHGGALKPVAVAIAAGRLGWRRCLHDNVAVPLGVFPNELLQAISMPGVKQAAALGQVVSNAPVLPVVGKPGS